MSPAAASLHPLPPAADVQPINPAALVLQPGPAGVPRASIRPVLRYTVACAAVLGLHAALFLYLRHMHPVPIGVDADVPPAVMIDLPPAAPVAAAPPPPDVQQPDLPQQKNQLQPMQETEKVPELPPSPAPAPEAVLPPPPKAPPAPRIKVKPKQHPPKPQPVEPPRPAQHIDEHVENAPPSPPAPPGPSSAQMAAAHAAQTTWQGKVAAHLLRFKRYPRMAEMRREEGTVRVRFSVDASGQVIGFTLLSSSGHELLDEGAREWIERAQPLPAPPEEVSHGRPVPLSVPLNFTISDR